MMSRTRMVWRGQGTCARGSQEVPVWAESEGLTDGQRVDVVPLHGGMDSDAAIGIPAGKDGPRFDGVVMMGRASGSARRW